MSPISAFCLRMLALLLVYSPAWAQVADLDSLADANMPRFQWSEAQAARLHGVPVHWREFMSSVSPFPTAQDLAVHKDRFQRVIAHKNGILLTGVRSEWHWLAEIWPAANGSQGRVSILRINMDQLGGLLQSRGHHRFPWLASYGARLHFSHESVVGGRRMVQEVYGASVPADQITAYVQQNLRRTGWKQEPQTAWRSGADMWRRASSRLLVASVSAEQGSTVFLQHIE